MNHPTGVQFNTRQVAADSLIEWVGEMDSPSPMPGAHDLRRLEVICCNGEWTIFTVSREWSSSSVGCGKGRSFVEAHNTIAECEGDDCPRCGGRNQ
jgi:hypothetical protein